MIILMEMIQGSREWIEARLGVLTASQVSKLVTPTGKLSASRTDLLCSLIAEKLTGEPADDFAGTYWTDRGQALEDDAGAYFSLQTGMDPTAVGFVYKDDTKRAGCSPDWLVYMGEDPICGVEVKCPKAATHVRYLLDEKADKYMPQIQFSLWVTDLPVWWFMSYHPGMPPLLRQFEPDKDWQAAFDKHVPIFLDEVSAALGRLSQ